MKIYETYFIAKDGEVSTPVITWPWDINKPAPREAVAIKELLMTLNQDQVIPVEVIIPKSDRKDVRDEFEYIDGHLIRRRLQYHVRTAGMKVSYTALRDTYEKKSPRTP